MSKSAWKILESLINESKQYRGESGWTLKQLNDLMVGSEFRDGFTGRPANREGEVVDGDYKFDPKIWGKWYPSIAPALTMASTDKDVVGQYAGRSQGGMTFKTTWGQRVVNVPGKARGDFERLPSAMDTYDVLMQGEVTVGKNGQPVGRLQRIAYSPAVGKSDERRTRLQAMIAGQDPGPLARRPQPDRPVPGKDTEQPAAAKDDPHQRSYADRPSTPSAGFRTGKGSRGKDVPYPAWYKPGRGGKRED